MATVVLVHGAFSGSWVWSKIVAALIAAGHSVFCPTLTGLGNRSSELAPQIGLVDHIKDVCTVIDRNNLSNVILLGHSYGGMVITGVAYKRANRLSQLVYLDAAVPHDKESLLDIVGPEAAQAFVNSARQAGDGWKVGVVPPQAFGLIEPQDIEWAVSQLTPQPLKTFADKVSVTDAIGVKKTYIHCTLSDPFLATQAARARAQGWRILKLNTPHSPMITHPVLFLEFMFEHILVS
jgi:pimeloyl-ACP methyl ester carboxylesterase